MARKSLISIGISTRDRWEELEFTLAKLADAGLDRYETIVIDDGSRKPVARELRERFSWVRFERTETSRGYILQRNWLASQLSAPVYLSLDDDSHVEHGDVEAAAEWLLGCEDAVALALRIVLENLQIRPETSAPYPVRYFIGCGHMLKRELFLNMGGYREELKCYCEEHEFALRANRSGYIVYSYPRVTVRHLMSETGRNLDRINFFLTRNDLWLAAWHFPLPYLILSYLNCLPRQLRMAVHRPYWRSIVRGFFSAILSLPKVWHLRDALSLRQFYRLRQYPHPHQLRETETARRLRAASRSVSGALH